MSLVRGGWRVADQAMIHPAGCFAQRTRLWPAPKRLPSAVSLTTAVLYGKSG
jgi:hypothetical protein